MHNELVIIEELLSQDPRPRYQDDPKRVYGMSYGSLEVKFIASQGLITVIDISQQEEDNAF